VVQTPQEFVERYRVSWEQVMNGHSAVASMTEYFNVPCLMVGAEGTLSEYSTAESIQSFNQSRLDAFRAGGATKAKLRGCDVTTLGSRCALAVVNWELHQADGTVERAWRHYYNLLRKPEGWRIVLSAFQVGS
jgi:hypothetical protein